MTSQEFRASVRAAIALLRELALLNIAFSFESLSASPEFRAAARDPRVSYTELYRTGLSRRDYNALLGDFSYFQFAYDPGVAPFGLRYAFYPNPYYTADLQSLLTEADELGRDGEGYEWYLQELSECEEAHLVPPIRYEVAFADYRELVHPTAHLHIGVHAENRWPVDRVLSPLAFAMMVAKHYYSNAWRLGDPTPSEAPGQNIFDERYSAEKLVCAPLSVDQFSGAERRQFYWG